MNAPDPVVYPPPCSHTMTGRLCPAPSPAVQMFKQRQSSLIGPPGSITSTSGGTTPRNWLSSCGARGPNSVASRTPDHGSGFRGGMKRAAPPVGAPYRTPLKTCTPRLILPRSFPAVVSTTGPAAVPDSVVSAFNFPLIKSPAAKVPKPMNDRLSMIAPPIRAQQLRHDFSHTHRYHSKQKLLCRPAPQFFRGDLRPFR